MTIIYVILACLVLYVIFFVGALIFAAIGTAIRCICEIGKPNPYLELQKYGSRSEAFLQATQNYHTFQPPAQNPVATFRQDSQRYIDYALRTPEARLDLAEKEQIEDGEFTLERHMKLSGPVAPPDRFTGLPSDRLPCLFPYDPHRRKNRLRGSEVDRTGLPF